MASRHEVFREFLEYFASTGQLYVPELAEEAVTGEGYFSPVRIRVNDLTLLFPQEVECNIRDDTSLIIFVQGDPYVKKLEEAAKKLIEEGLVIVFIRAGSGGYLLVGRYTYDSRFIEVSSDGDMFYFGWDLRYHPLATVESLKEMLRQAGVVFDYGVGLGTYDWQWDWSLKSLTGRVYGYGSRSFEYILNDLLDFIRDVASEM